MSMMLVNSIRLRMAAAEIRLRDGAYCHLHNGVPASPEQLEAAADILQAAEPSQITHASGVRSGSINYDPQERPGFIDAGRQEDENVLVFDVGILPTTTYRIARDGAVEEAN